MWQQRWVILGLAVVAAAAAFLITRTQSSKYDASAQLQIVPAEQAIGRPLGSDELLQLTNTYAEQARSFPTQQRAWSAVRRTQNDAGSLERFRESVDVSTDSAGGLVKITATTTDPRRSVAFATRYAEVFGRIVDERQDAQQRITLRRLTAASTALRRTRASRADGPEREALQLQVNSIEMRLSETLAAPRDRLRTIQPALLPTSPVSPKPLLSALIAAMIGFALGGTIVYFRALVSGRFADEAEVSSALSLPILGSIPNFSKVAGPSHEAFKLLRLSIEVELGTPDRARGASADGTRGRTLLVTSTLEDEGKSLIASSLAQALADHGWRTLLVDTDLRRPTVHTLNDVPLSPGLSDVLDGEHQQQSLLELHRTASSDGGALTIVPAGSGSARSVASLTSSRMRGLIGTARDQFDFTILDAPPIALVADAADLAMISDGVLFVVDVKRTRRRAAQRATAYLAATLRVRVVGLVVNRVATTPTSYGYYDPAPTKRPMEVARERL